VELKSQGTAYRVSLNPPFLASDRGVGRVLGTPD
jgi:hypothetical protein